MKTITVAAGLIAGTMIFLLQPMKTAEAEIQPSPYIEEIVAAVDNISPEAPAEIPKVIYDVPLYEHEQEIIRDICIYYGIDMKLVMAIASKESNYQEDAVGDKGRSLGMYQIQPQYCEDIYNDEGPINLLDKYDATVACCKVLNYLYERYQDTMKVLNAYNTGDPDNYNGCSADILRIMEEIQTWEL